MNNKWRKDYMKQGYKFMSYKIITYILKHIPVVYIFVSVLIICSFLIFSLNSLFNKQFLYQILILSSKNEACGLDLSFVSDIIIFEPILGNYVKDIEKQIVGRIYRINQISECNVHRLMIKDTIEEQIYADL